MITKCSGVYVNHHLPCPKEQGHPAAASAGYGAWVDVNDELPAIGQRVILFSNGVVQNEIFTFDAADTSDYSPPEYFWSRDDLDECPSIENGQKWIPLPKAP